MKNLVKTIQNTAFQNDLWTKGSKIVLGISGGPDSACLLDIFAKLKKKYDLELIVAHVNYGLRGKDSDRDEKFVRELAKKHGLHSEFLKLRFRKAPSENELRDIRYEFFEKVRQKYDFDLIAVAHNMDDQVETYLMRIIRGAGLQGLSAMKYKSGPPQRIIRPLLGTSRKDILEYLKANRLKYRIDITNKQLMFFRNKIRSKLIPYLEKNFNPQIKKIIAASVGSIAEDNDLLSALAEKYFRKNKELKASEILKLHPALQRRIILKAISKVKLDLKDIGAVHVEEILKALKSTKSKHQVVIFKGLKLTRKGDKVIINNL